MARVGIASRLGLGPLAGLALLASGCGDDGGMLDGGARDARVDARDDAAGADTGSPIPDGAKLCEQDSECDDGVECTLDICDPRGFCRNPGETAACDDGVFCNGVERCDPVEGCVPGAPESCNDNDICTIDRCDEESDSCLHEPRDFDQDGEADWRCEGGTDCDDFDPSRGSMVAEVCSDGIDNDCDEVVDESDCGRPEHDTCEDALDVSDGGTFVLNNQGATADYQLGCGGDGRKDMVLTFTLEQSRDLEVQVDGASVTWVGLRTQCADSGSETDCATGFPAMLRARALEPGTYFVIVKDAGSGETRVDVDFSAPTEPADNETCANPEDISGGGSFEGSFLDVEHDLSTECGGDETPDLVYSFTLEEQKDVVLTATAESGDNLNFALRSECGNADTTIRCSRGAPASTRVYSLEPGTWYLVLEGPSFNEVDFTLDVAFEAPSDPPAGDTCGNPITLPLGEETLGDLSNKQDDINVSCGFFYPDIVHTFEVSEPSEVDVTVDGGSSFMSMSLRETCSDGSSQLRCSTGRPAQACVRYLPAGSYDLITESPRASSFNVTVEATPADTMPTEASGNDLCMDAVEVPSSGGLFTGTTEGLNNDYGTSSSCGSGSESPDATFRLDLSETKRVVASTECSTYDTVLYYYQGQCQDGSEVACDDDSGRDGRTSRIETELGPGTWFFVVDGWGSSSSGEYTAKFDVQDP